MTTCKQVHGNKVACITEENISSGAISFANSIDDTDALITNLKMYHSLYFLQIAHLL